MKIKIFYKSTQKSWGGGNQFLKALRGEFENRGIYTDSAKEADVMLFNGYQEVRQLFLSWIFDNKKKRVYRLGPIMSLHRKGFKWKLIDYLVVFFANFFADLVIFQSKWSYSKSLEFGFSKNKKYKIIFNTVDGNIFYKKQNEEKNPTKPFKLIYTSWSKNINKGFLFLNFLDENLDFNKYKMRFIGNSPFSFKNIKTIPALDSKHLAEELRKSNLFVSPTKDDACSNAILEALACGLPVVALNSGANSEIIGDGGLVFSNMEEMIRAVDKVSRKLSKYQSQIRIRNLEEISQEYILAIESMCGNMLTR